MKHYLSSTHIKIVSWLAIVSSGVGLYTFFYYAIFQGQGTNIGLWPIFFLCMLGFYSGYLAIKNEIKGKKFLIIFFAIQLFQYSSPTVMVNFTAGISFFYSMTSGNGTMGINIFAFVLFLLSIRMYNEHKSLTSSSSGTTKNQVVP